MDTPPPQKIRKSACPFGDDFYSTIAKHLNSDEPEALDQLKEMAKVVQNAKLQPTDEFWDSGDELSSEVEAILKSVNKPKKVKAEKKEKSEEKEVAEKPESDQPVEQTEPVEDEETA